MIDIFEELQWRGLVYQSTREEGMSQWLTEKPRVVYAGFDPTATSLHVGSLMPLLMLRRFQKAGHKPIALVGGATGMIGDPSGKSDERNLLNADQLKENLAGIENQIRKFLSFDSGETSAIVVNNAEWVGKFSYIDFLRDVGKNFPVNVMLSKESVKNRLGSDAGISYTEFSYMLLQAYDFVHLFKEFGCELQVGGSDQWGNVTAGIDLGRRMTGAQLVGITNPLLTKSDGTKMGKTESGAVWLDAERTSPYQFYQYWINVSDDDVGKCLRFLTELGRDEIEELDNSRENDPGKNESQKRLAQHLTEMVHGKEGLATARTATDIFFGAEIKDLKDKDLKNIFDDVPSADVQGSDLADEGLNVADALVTSTLAKSKGDARRAIAQGGVYINNRRCESDTRSLTRHDLASETMIVLRRGKKNYALLRCVD